MWRLIRLDRDWSLQVQSLPRLKRMWDWSEFQTERWELRTTLGVEGGAKDLMKFSGEVLAGAEVLRPMVEAAFERVAASHSPRPRLGNVQDPIKDWEASQ